MPIVVNYDPNFGPVAAVAHQAGYGIYQQKQAEIARDQMNRDRDMAFTQQQAALDRQEKRAALAAQLRAQEIGIQADQQARQQNFAMRNAEFQQNQQQAWLQQQMDAQKQMWQAQMQQQAFQQDQAQQAAKAMQDGLKSGTLKYTTAQKAKMSELYNQMDRLDMDDKIREQDKQYGRQTLQQQLDAIRPRPVAADERPVPFEEELQQRVHWGSGIPGDNSKGHWIKQPNGDVEYIKPDVETNNVAQPIYEQDDQGRRIGNVPIAYRIGNTVKENTQHPSFKDAGKEEEKKIKVVETKAKAHATKLATEASKYGIDAFAGELAQDIANHELYGDKSTGAISPTEQKIRGEIAVRKQVERDYNLEVRKYENAKAERENKKQEATARADAYVKTAEQLESQIKAAEPAEGKKSSVPADQLDHWKKSAQAYREEATNLKYLSEQPDFEIKAAKTHEERLMEMQRLRPGYQPPAPPPEQVQGQPEQRPTNPFDMSTGLGPLMQPTEEQQQYQQPSPEQAHRQMANSISDWALKEYSTNPALKSKIKGQADVFGKLETMLEHLSKKQVKTPADEEMLVQIKELMRREVAKAIAAKEAEAAQRGKPAKKTRTDTIVDSLLEGMQNPMLRF